MAGNGKFYGTTFMGGNGDYGTIFSFDPTTNAQAKLLILIMASAVLMPMAAWFRPATENFMGWPRVGAAEDWVQFTHSTQYQYVCEAI